MVAPFRRCYTAHNSGVDSLSDKSDLMWRFSMTLDKIRKLLGSKPAFTRHFAFVEISGLQKRKFCALDNTLMQSPLIHYANDGVL